MYLIRLFTTSLFTHVKEKASEASAKYGGLRWFQGGQGGVCERSFYLDLHPLPSQVFCFALASSALATLSACSTIEYEKTEGCDC